MPTDQELFDEAFECHLRDPRITESEHLRRKEISLGSQVMRLHRIFLDTRYWILLRNHIRGTQPNDHIGKLYAALLDLVDAGKAICPTSVEVVAEVKKQTDRATREFTAELMDRLGRSVVIQPEGRRVGREILDFLSRGQPGGAQLPPLRKLVWTRPFRLPVGPEPSVKRWPPAQRSAAARAMIDVLWQKTVLDFVRAGDAWPLNTPYAETHDAFPTFVAEQMNEGRAELPASFPSFRKHFLEHLDIALDAYGPMIEHIAQTVGLRSTRDSHDASGSHGPGARAIRIAFEKRTVAASLPYFHILPGILTAFDRDRTRRYKPNDMTDYFVAASALPYCDMYLTEGPFRHLLTSEPLAFDQRFGTRIISEPSEAADAVAALTSA